MFQTRPAALLMFRTRRVLEQRSLAGADCRPEERSLCLLPLLHSRNIAGARRSRVMGLLGQRYAPV